MATNTSPNVLTVQESTRFEPGGTAVRVTVITYMVGKDGPFTLEVGPDQNTVAFIQEQLAKKAADLAAIRSITA